jgi:hypothetical protein
LEALLSCRGERAADMDRLRQCETFSIQQPCELLVRPSCKDSSGAKACSSLHDHDRPTTTSRSRNAPVRCNPDVAVQKGYASLPVGRVGWGSTAAEFQTKQRVPGRAVPSADLRAAVGAAGLRNVGNLSLHSNVHPSRDEQHGLRRYYSSVASFGAAHRDTLPRQYTLLAPFKMQCKKEWPPPRTTLQWKWSLERGTAAHEIWSVRNAGRCAAGGPWRGITYSRSAEKQGVFGLKSVHSL